MTVSAELFGAEDDIGNQDVPWSVLVQGVLAFGEALRDERGANLAGPSAVTEFTIVGRGSGFRAPACP